MKRWHFLSVVALAATSLSACSSSDGSAADAESFEDMYADNTADGNTQSVFGTWGLTQEQSGFTQDTRVTLAADKIRFATRCSKDTDSVIAGITLPATVTETTLVVPQGGKDQKQVQNALCLVQITAGQGTLALKAGQLDFGGAYLFTTKYSD
jgi:hypothetical protein